MHITVTTPLVLLSEDGSATLRHGSRASSPDGWEFEIQQDGRAVLCGMALSELGPIRDFLVDLFPRRPRGSMSADHATRSAPAEIVDGLHRFCVAYTNDSSAEGFREGVRISVFAGARPLACVDFFGAEVIRLRDWLVANLPRD